jgi:hypothetical protein
MSKTKYLFLSLLLLSNLANAQAGPAGGGASSTQTILLLILGILIIRIFYKSKSMSAEKLGEKIGKFLASLKGWQWILYPMIIFFAYVFFIDTPNKKSSSLVKEDYVTPSSSNSSSSSRTSYEKDVVFNQGYTDYSNSLKGGIKLSIDEERMVFGVKFPKGNDEDFQNYQNGCQRAFGEFSTKNY